MAPFHWPLLRHADPISISETLFTTYRNQRSQLITDTSIASSPAGLTVCGVRSPFDRDGRFRIFRSLADQPKRFHSDIDNHWCTWQSWLCQPVLNQTPLNERHPISRSEFLRCRSRSQLRSRSPVHYQVWESQTSGQAFLEYLRDVQPRTCSLLESFPPNSLSIVLFRKNSTVSPPHHPKKGLIHKSPADQYVNSTSALDLLWIWPLFGGGRRKKTDKSTIEGVVWNRSAPFWDDEVGPLLKVFENP